MRIDLFWLGYSRFSFSPMCAKEVFALLERARVTPKALERDEKNGKISFLCSLREAKRIRILSAQNGVALECAEQGGVPVAARALLCRPGLVFGTVMALILLVCARLFVWDIRFEGLEGISCEEMTQVMAQAGLESGSFLPSLDAETLIAKVREKEPRVAYVSINLRGTVAYVQIRESTQGEQEGGKQPANLVARCDGVVTLPLVFEGQCYVEPGDVVRAGQILAGGFIDSENHGTRVMRAAGQILAKTTHVYTVNVPFAYEEKTYTGREQTAVSLLFFGMAGKVFKNPVTNIKECDIIENTKWVSVWGGIRLPLGYSCALAREYVTVPAVRNALQARALALAQLEELLAADSAGRILLERTVEIVADEDGITVICTVVCEEDIGLTVDIEYS